MDSDPRPAARPSIHGDDPAVPPNRRAGYRAGGSRLGGDGVPAAVAPPPLAFPPPLRPHLGLRPPPPPLPPQP